MDSQFSYNITFDINVKIIDFNIRWKYLFFTVYYTNNWKLNPELITIMIVSLILHSNIHFSNDK